MLLYQGELEEPAWTYLLVGPLPVSSQTTWQPLNYPFTRKTPVVETYPDYNYHVLEKLEKDIKDSVRDILEDLWNLTRRDWDDYGSSFEEDDKLIVWHEFWGKSTQSIFDDYDLLPLGQYFVLNSHLV